MLSVARRVFRSRSGSVAAMAAILMPAMLGFSALAIDSSVWLIEQHRLQIAADAAAYAAALQLSNSSMQSSSPGSYAALAANEVAAALGGSLSGSAVTTQASVAAKFASVTVSVSSVADTYFVQAVKGVAPTISATSTAGVKSSAACVLALNPSAAQALSVGGSVGSGTVDGTNCGVFSNSTSSSAIYVNSGTISASSIGAVGGVTTSSSGSNSLTPTPTTGDQSEPDPDASLVAPTPGQCTYTGQSFTAYGTYSFANGTNFCGTTTIGGNGGTDSFAPGVYFVTGNLTFSNANISQGTGITFVLVGSGSNPAPSMTWTNNSASTLTAPTSNANGGVPGVLIWQVCPPGQKDADVNGAITFNDGSPMTVSGTIYAPCGNVTLQDDATLETVSGGALNLIASTILVDQTSVLKTTSSTATTGSSSVSLLQ